MKLAYRIATVEATVAGELHRLQVVDLMGETPLSGGRHTYRLDLFDGASLPVLEFALRYRTGPDRAGLELSGEHLGHELGIRVRRWEWAKY